MSRQTHPSRRHSQGSRAEPACPAAQQSALGQKAAVLVLQHQLVASRFEPAITGTPADVAARAASVSRGRDPSTWVAVDCEEACTTVAGGAVLGDVLVVGPDIWTIATSRPIGLASAGESVQPAGG
jgi:hypothetical protein